MKPILRIEGLSKLFSGNPEPVVDQLSFDVSEGEILCLMGENGAGKSTLLRLLAGLSDADGGNIFFQNEEIKGPSKQLVAGHPKIKLLKQDDVLNPKINVFENIRYELRAYPYDYIKERIETLVQLCNLRGLEQKLPHELSGGQKQRAALARTMADAPEVILLDEPFSNTDVIQKLKSKKEIFNIFKDTKTTLIFSTHDAAEALSLSDVIIVMQYGKIIQQGNPQQIYNRPAHPYIASLTGTCNFIPVKMLPFSGASHASLACIRIEDVSVCADEVAHFKGKIVEKIYLGATYELTVRISESIILKLLVKDDIPTGQRISLLLNKEKMILFKSDRYLAI
jgi:ABC-type Fe3+/spermidine/putrescine transport system ATPase subunit